MNEQTQLDALLLCYDEHRARSAPVSPEELCKDCPQLLDELKRRIQILERMNAKLGSVTKTGTSAEPTRPNPSRVRPGEALSTVSHYQIVRFHGAEGLAEVHVTRDRELGRDVALRRLQTLQAGNPYSRVRLLREAAITSRLDHPNIAPIFGWGEDADGCPFYAIRLVQGQTLEEAIEQFHETDQGRTLPEPHFAFWHLLSRFIVVCNAVAYAHSKGIVHRDIRPDNIVLGLYGETCLVGWGLAKDGEAREGTRPSAPDSESQPAHPEMADAIRTPVYMSPEQAEGQWELVRPASDVYSLGATLYTLLTGEPPFQGSQVDEVLNNVARGEFLAPRQKNNGVPRALEKICLKAMAGPPEDRYATASELALELEHWVADESASAYFRPWMRRRWGRHHWRVLTAAAAMLLTAVGAFSINTVWIREYKQTARSARAQADQNLRLARQVVDKTVTAVTASSRAKEADSRPLRRELLAAMLPFCEQLLMQQQNDPELKAERGRAVATLALLTHEVTKSNEAPFDYQYLLVRVRSDYELARDIFSQLAADFPTVLPYRQELVRCTTSLADLLREMLGSEMLGHRVWIKPSQVEAAYRDALRIQAQLAADFPTVPQYRQELVAGFYNLSKMLREANKRGESEAAYRDALRTQRELVAAFPTVPQYRQELAASLYNLGYLLLYDLRRHGSLDETDETKGAYRDAETAHREALKIQTQLVADFPAVPQYRQELASSLYNLGNLVHAQGQFVYRLLNEPDETRTAYRDAETAYREALRIQAQLAADFPAVPQYRQKLARSQTGLAKVLRTLGKHRDAEALYREALKIRAQLAADFPAVAAYHHDFSETLGNLASLVRTSAPLVRTTNMAQRFRAPAELAEARKLLEQAVMHDGAALLADPRNPAFCAYFRANRQVLARALLDLGDHAAAAAAADQMIRAVVEPTSDAYNGACILARCVALAKSDGQLSDAERTERAEYYTGRALAALQQAVHNGYKNTEFMQLDEELEPLRTREDFQKLLAEIEEKRARPGK